MKVKKRKENKTKKSFYISMIATSRILNVKCINAKRKFESRKRIRIRQKAWAN